MTLVAMGLMVSREIVFTEERLQQAVTMLML